MNSLLKISISLFIICTYSQGIAIENDHIYRTGLHSSEDIVTEDLEDEDFFGNSSFAGLEFLSKNSFHVRMTFLDLPYSFENLDRAYISAALFSFSMGLTYIPEDTATHISFNPVFPVASTIFFIPSFFMKENKVSDILYILGIVTIAPQLITNPVFHYEIVPDRIELFAGQRTDLHVNSSVTSLQIYTETIAGCKHLGQWGAIGIYGAYSYIDIGFKPHRFHAGVTMNFMFKVFGGQNLQYY